MQKYSSSSSIQQELTTSCHLTQFWTQSLIFQTLSLLTNNSTILISFKTYFFFTIYPIFLRYSDSTIIDNLGTVFLVICFNIVLTLIYAAVWIIVKFMFAITQKQKTKKFLKRILNFKSYITNIYLSLMIENYL